MASSQKFDEIRVFEGIAERTGNIVDRDTIRGSKAMCRSLTELTRRVRRMGDGTFYLPVALWPEGKTTLPMSETWITLS